VLRRLLLVVAASCVTATAHAQDQRLGTPQLEGFESVANADGALGTIFNPALVGMRYPSELLIANTRDDRGHALRWDGLGAWRGLGVRWTRIPHQSQTLGGTLAFGAPAFRFGWTTEWSGGDLGAPDRSDHRLGLLSRPNPWLSLGVTLDHPFQPRGTKRVYTAGVAFRPLALPVVGAPVRDGSTRVDASRLTIFADARIPERSERRFDEDRHRAVSLRFGAEMELVSGIALRGSVETSTREFGGSAANAGLVFRLPRASVSGRAGTVEDVSGATETYAVSFHSGEEATRLRPPSSHRVGTLALSGILGDDDLSSVSLFGAESVTPVGPIARDLDRALHDPLTRGVLLELDGVHNQAAIEELRPRVLALRAAGKPVVAYLENGGGRGDLVLASACNQIFSTDEALFWQLGLRAERRYYRRFLDHLGVRMDRSAIGKYKSAYREYSADSTSPADREEIERVLDQAEEHVASTLASARHMERARLDTLLDGRQWPTSELVKAGLIDSVGYREQALRSLARLAGLGRRARSEELASITPAERAWQPVRAVAVVYASGAIETGESGNDLFDGATLGSTTLVRQIEDAFRSSARAVVLRIDSPGGSVLASDLIYHTLQRMKQETKKPLIVSMGSVAASGGYYIALPGQRIFADRMTETGSIGVVFLHPSFEGFYAKHDVHEDDFLRGAYMRGGSLAHDWDAQIQASADSSIARSYDRFVDRVVLSRGLPRATVLENAQGRVWLGEDARTRGLVDEIGGLDAALAYARKLAGLPAGVALEPLEFRRPRPGLLQRVVGSWVRAEVARNARVAEPQGVRWEAGDDVDF